MKSATQRARKFYTIDALRIVATYQVLFYVGFSIFNNYAKHASILEQDAKTPSDLVMQRVLIGIIILAHVIGYAEIGNFAFTWLPERYCRNVVSYLGDDNCYKKPEFGVHAIGVCLILGELILCGICSQTNIDTAALIITIIFESAVVCTLVLTLLELIVIYFTKHYRLVEAPKETKEI